MKVLAATGLRHTAALPFSFSKAFLFPNQLHGQHFIVLAVEILQIQNGRIEIKAWVWRGIFNSTWDASIFCRDPCGHCLLGCIGQCQNYLAHVSGTSDIAVLRCVP